MATLHKRTLQEFSSVPDIAAHAPHRQLVDKQQKANEKDTQPRIKNANFQINSFTYMGHSI